MNNSNNNDLIKIEEDAIKIQEQDLRDTIISIDNETTKSSLVIGFAGVLFGIAFNYIDKLSFLQIYPFILLLLSSVGIALWNISAKQVNIHTDLHRIFVTKEPNNWGKYLNYKHLHLQESYSSAKSLLYKKALFTKISFILLILSSLSLLLSKLGVL